MAYVTPRMGYAGLDSKTAGSRPRTASEAETLSRKQAKFDDLFLRWNHSPKIERKDDVRLLHGRDVKMSSLSHEAHRLPIRRTGRAKSPAKLRKEAMELFKMYDRDGNSSLDVREFKKLLRDAGLGSDLNFREFSDFVKRDFSTIDTDGNHTVDIDEFILYYMFANQNPAANGSARETESPTRQKQKVEMQRKLALLRQHVHDDFSYTPGLAKVCWLQKTLHKQTKNMDQTSDPKLMNLDEACHVGNVAAARMCVERGETVCFGGVPPIVRATANLHYDLVAYLVMNKKLDPTLLMSERAFVVDCCRRRDQNRLHTVMRDLYTHSMQRTKIVDAMLNEDVESAREGFKKVYFSHMSKKSSGPRTKEFGAWFVHARAVLSTLHNRCGAFCAGITSIKDEAVNNELGARLVSLCQSGMTKLVRRCLQLVMGVPGSLILIRCAFARCSLKLRT